MSDMKIRCIDCIRSNEDGFTDANSCKYRHVDCIPSLDVIGQIVSSITMKMDDTPQRRYVTPLVLEYNGYDMCIKLFGTVLWSDAHDVGFKDEYWTADDVELNRENVVRKIHVMWPELVAPVGHWFEDTSEAE